MPVGIIPALAGNTTRICSRAILRGDHPRACGEHIAHADCVEHIQGSSPRLRGTPGRTGVERRRGGIIPALAGNTDRVTKKAAAFGDHPRACGEH